MTAIWITLAIAGAIVILMIPAAILGRILKRISARYPTPTHPTQRQGGDQ